MTVPPDSHLAFTADGAPLTPRLYAILHFRPVEPPLD